MGFGKSKGVLWNKGRSTEYMFTVLKKMYAKYDWTYLVAGQEYAPTTGSAHIDFYYEQCTQRTEKTERKKFVKNFGIGFGDLKNAKGTAGENLDYSEKEGNEFIKLGEPTKQGARSDLYELCDSIAQGELTPEDIALVNPEKFHQYGRTFDKVEDIRLRSLYRTEMPQCFWLWGKTDVGKSHIAFEGYTPQTHYVWKNDNGWQDGYRQQQYCIINEFRGEIPYRELLQLIDKWPHFLRRRNREPMPFTSPRIIITSPMPPEMVYCQQVTKVDSIDQLLRRLVVIELSGPGTVLPWTT